MKTFYSHGSRTEHGCNHSPTQWKPVTSLLASCLLLLSFPFHPAHKVVGGFEAAIAAARYCAAWRAICCNAHLFGFRLGGWPSCWSGCKIAARPLHTTLSPSFALSLMENGGSFLLISLSLLAVDSSLSRTLDCWRSLSLTHTHTHTLTCQREIDR